MDGVFLNTTQSLLTPLLVMKVALVVINFVSILVFIAFFTTFERKVMASMQRRLGPDLVGFKGLLQPFADGLKLALKETLIAKDASSLFFLAAPLITFALSLTSWLLLPFTEFGSLSNPENSAILYLAVSSLGVYGIILAGWASNSKYSFLGCIRSTAQIISYEVMFSFTIFPLFLIGNTASLHLMNDSFYNPLNFGFIGTVTSSLSLNAFLLYPTSLIFLISALAETNRTPFDLPEAEAELVAGYNIEYSSLSFALFFLGEYSNMGSISLLFTILYLNSYSPLLDMSWMNLQSLLKNFGDSALWVILDQSLTVALKTILVCFFIIWVRGTLPRYRFDQLIALCWTKLLPLALSYFLLLAGFLYFVTFAYLI